MKRMVLIMSFFTLIFGTAGCGTESTNSSRTRESKKVESSIDSSSESSSQSIEQKSEQSTSQTNFAESEDKSSDSAFKELLSGIEYNKEYLTEEQATELKETYKSSLTEEQYQELAKMLEDVHDGDA